MEEHLSNDQVFIRNLTEIILANMEDENFSIRELASKSGLSPRSLNKRLHSINNKTINQLIREVRLRRALEILQREKVTVSEVAYKVGFNSPTYFNTCFNEFFGYPPGQVKRGTADITEEIHPLHPVQDDSHKGHSLRIFILTLSGIIVLAFLGFLVHNAFSKKTSADASIHLKNKGKSIAVLPFKNISNSVENQYFIDGVMEEILTNLSRIHDLRVISRTSVEQFRINTRSVSEIANILDVAYIVEGSGQKYGNTFRLRMQLIETSTDRHIWAESYEKEIKETKDIFSIQSQIAQAIASELKVTITPAEKLLIQKSATEHLTAYDFYQRGREENQKYCMDNKNIPSLKKAKVLYNKALEIDSAFAPAYAGLAEVYWDEHIYEQFLSKRFLDSVLILCNIALSYDDKLSLAYVIKGDYYRLIEKPELAIKEYDNALKFNPNDYVAYLGKGVLYYWKCDFILAIENFQKVITLNRDKLLPVMLSSLSYAYLASGFVEKARNYCLESFRLSADSIQYYYVLSDIESCSGNYNNAINYLEKAFARDSTNNQILFGLGKNYMLNRQKEKSLIFFKNYLGNAKTLVNEDLFGMYRIGWAFWQNGYKAEAENCFVKQIDYFDKMVALDRTMRDQNEVFLCLAGMYAFKGEKVKAYKNLGIYNQNKKIDLWDVSLVKNDPLFDRIRDEPEFQEIVINMEKKYNAEHERVSKWIEERDMLHD